MMNQSGHSNNIFHWLHFVVVATGIIYCFTFETFHVHQGGLSAKFLTFKLPFINGLFFYLVLSAGIIFSIFNQISSKKYYQATIFDGLLITYVLYNACSLFWVKDFGLGLAALTTAISFYVFYYLVNDLFKRNVAFAIQWIGYLIYALTIVFVIHFFIKNIDVLLLFKNSDHSFQKIITQSKSWVGGKNQTACFLALVLPVIVLLKPQKWLSVFLLSLVSIQILIMGSRNAYIGLIVFFGIYMLFNKIKLKQLAVGGILLSVVLLLFWAFIGFDVFINQLKNNTWGSRFIFWQQTLRMGADHWLFGVGAGQWDAYRLQYDVWFTYKHPHNDFVRNFAELGMVGFFLFYAIIATPLATCFNNLKQNKKFAATAIASIAVYLSLSFFDESKMKDNFNILLALVFALVNYKLFNGQSLKTNSKFISYGFCLFLSTMALFLILYPLNFQQQINHFKHRNIYLKQKNKLQAIAELKKINQTLVSTIDRNPVNSFIANTYITVNQADSAAVYYEKVAVTNPYYINQIEGRLELYLARNRIGKAWWQLCILYLLNPCSTGFGAELIGAKVTRQTRRYRNIIKNQQAKCKNE